MKSRPGPKAGPRGGRSRGTRVHRGASPRRARPAPARRHSTARRRPPRRGSRYARRPPASRPSFSNPLVLATVAGTAFLALAGILLAHHVALAANPQGQVAAQLIYTAPTGNDARVSFPAAVKNLLLQIGLTGKSVALTRIGYNGNASTSDINMTPLAGNSVLRVKSRAIPVIDAKISAIEQRMNTPMAATGGGQALYVGLTRADFTRAPVTIISSGLDLANPDNFRSLNWSVPPQDVVANV